MSSDDEDTRTLKQLRRGRVALPFAQVYLEDVDKALRRTIRTLKKRRLAAAEDATVETMVISGTLAVSACT